MTNLYFIDNNLYSLPKQNMLETNGRYDDSWVFLKLIDTDKYSLMTGTDIIFGLTISIKSDHWHYNLMDFIYYHKMYNRKIIMMVDESKYLEAVERYKGHNISDKFLRSYEPNDLVHSTTYESYKKILKDGYIKSWNVLRKEKYLCEDNPIGHRLGDPTDFSDFVMLGWGVAPEIVVSSKQKGYICMESECEYQPGARFYFKTDKLTRDGLLVRDGAHYKVKDMLSIEYCDMVVTNDDLPKDKSMTTPHFFAQFADELYLAR